MKISVRTQTGEGTYFLVIFRFICTQIELDDEAVKTASCECVLRDYFCHHVAAVLLFG